jgi:hypothetical protein
MHFPVHQVPRDRIFVADVLQHLHRCADACFEDSLDGDFEEGLKATG